MKKLALKNKNYNIVDYWDLQNFIETVWEDRFKPLKNKFDSFCIIGEQPNDSVLTFDDIKKEKIDEWDNQKLQKFYDTSYIEGFSLRVVLTQLCNEGLIEPGNYMIDVSW